MLLIGLLFLFSQLVNSEGKALKSIKHNKNGILRISDVIEQESTIKGHQVKWPIESSFYEKRSHNSESNKGKTTKTSSHKGSRRCFCRLPSSVSCPDGCQTGPIAPQSSFPGPPYDVEEEWPWLQQNNNGDLTEIQFGTHPCGQYGWCCKSLYTSFDFLSRETSMINVTVSPQPKPLSLCVCVKFAIHYIRGVRGGGGGGGVAFLD